MSAAMDILVEQYKPLPLNEVTRVRDLPRAMGPDGRRMYPGMLPEQHPEQQARSKRWQRFLEHVPKITHSEVRGTAGAMPIMADDKEFLHVEEWRRPSWHRRNLMVALDEQVARNREIEKQPRRLLEGLPPEGLQQVLVENTTTTDIADFTAQSLVMLSQYWPREYIRDIVPHVTFPYPTGAYFTEDFLFATSGETYAQDSRIDNVEDPDYTDDPGECQNINEIDARITQSTFSSETLKVYSQVSVEAQQNALAQYAYNIDTSLMRKHAELMSRNRQRKVIEAMRTGATGGIATFDKTTPGAGVYSTIDPVIYKKTLYFDMNEVTAEIFGNTSGVKTTGWAVGDEDTAKFLFDTEAFTIDNVAGFQTGQSLIGTSPNLFGTIRGLWDFYIDPYLVTNQIVMGARGQSVADSAYVVMDWIGFVGFPLWIQPQTACMHRGSMMRYSRQMLRANNLGRIDLFES